jgi:hypothetical protein
MVTLVIIVKALVEVAALALIGQGALHVLAGATREQNIFYKILQTITKPLLQITRWITPKFVLNAHIGFVAFFLVAGIWVASLFELRAQCHLHPTHPACAKLQSVDGPNR